jgi:tetratricopeptide (TPR) repeat protein
LEEGWQRNDLAALTEARAEAERAVELAGRVWAGGSVQQETARFQAEAQERLERAKKNRRLLDALLDISIPHETRSYQVDASGHMIALARPSVDEQYATAFQRWGLDVDGTEEAEVIARLGQEPDVVVQEAIAGLDGWMMDRRRRHPLEPGWRRLYRIAEQLDGQATRRQLRALLVEGAAPTPEAVAGLLSPGSVWPALWQVARGETWRRAQELRARLDLRQEPALTVVLVALVYRVVGDTGGAMEVLREAAELRPNQLVLLDVLAQQLEEQQRWEEAVGCYRAIRVQRPELGVALAHALVRVGRFREAETVARELLRQQPSHPDLYNLLGNVLKDGGRDEEAIEQLRRAIQLSPRYARAHFNLGVVLHNKGREEEAIEHLRQALSIEPGYARAHNNLGAALKAKGRVDEAIEHYRRALALEPRFAGAHTNLGNALSSKGRKEEAIEYYRQALSLDPGFAPAHYNLGIVLEGKGLVDEAIVSYRQAIQFDPGYAKPHSQLGGILFRRGRVEEATQHFRQAVALDPGYVAGHFNLGTALRSQGQLDEAIVYYRRAIQLSPRFALAHSNLAAALMDKGRLDEAAEHYRQALQLDPRDVKAHFNLGTILHRKGRLDEASEHYRRTIELDPRDVKAYFNLASILHGKRRWDEAIVYYRRALQLDPELVVAHRAVAGALYLEGQVEESIEHYRQAIRLDPRLADAYAELGEVLLREGQLAQALEMLRRSLDLLEPNHPDRPAVTRLLGRCQRMIELDEQLLQGKAKSASVMESLALGRLCVQHKKLYVASARFYREAFTKQPKSANDLPEQHRYRAACAAALAGRGAGKDAGELGEPERSDWRRQALDWLRADLAGWGRVVDQDDTRTRTRAHKLLRRWQTDPDLAGVREPAELARLPAEERQAWQKLWVDVAALLKRSERREKPLMKE